MNDRLKELAEQNGFIHKWMSPGEQHDKLQSLEKFALLIVRECANVADENYIHRGSRTCGLAIRLHFGVEE